MGSGDWVRVNYMGALSHDSRYNILARTPGVGPNSLLVRFLEAWKRTTGCSKCGRNAGTALIEYSVVRQKIKEVTG